MSQFEEQLRRLQEERAEVQQLQGTLDKFSGLDLDLGLLQGRKRFLDVHIGTLPEANVQRLSEAAGSAGYMLDTFLVSGEVAYVVVAGPLGEQEEEVHRLLSAAGFHPLAIPPAFRDHPEKVQQDLSGRAAHVQSQLSLLRQRIRATAARYRDELGVLAATLDLAAPYAQLAETLRGRGGLTLVTGWVPRSDVERLRQGLDQALANPFVLEARDPFPDERSRVPSFVRHTRLLLPFADLVKNYGVPRYGELDPTLMFAVTFIAMFGMMFGDVGHGAVFIGAGLALPKRLRRFLPCVVGVGLASTLFGFLYGSVFGYEDLLEPLWVAPLSNPMLMLSVAFYWGVGFILLASGLAITNRISDHRYAEALLDGNGVAGLWLYLGGLYLGSRWFQGQPVGWLALPLLALPLAVILGFKWHEQRTRLGERALVVFMEGFETVLGYIANTLSFLRVAAFSLNHVALAIAVFTLAEMLGTAGHWITVILGNVFIIVLEGAIVAIQVLRLEYYEGFSRFFGGQGREFCPITLVRRGDGSDGSAVGSPGTFRGR